MYIDLTIVFNTAEEALKWRQLAIDDPKEFANQWWLPTSSFDVQTLEDGGYQEEVQLYITDGELPDALWWKTCNDYEDIKSVYIWYTSDAGDNRGELWWRKEKPEKIQHVYIPVEDRPEEGIFDEYEMEEYYDGHQKVTRLDLTDLKKVDEWLEQFDEE